MRVCGPMRVFSHDVQSKYVVIPIRGSLTIWHEQLDVIYLVNVQRHHSGAENRGLC